MARRRHFLQIVALAFRDEKVGECLASNPGLEFILAQHFAIGRDVGVFQPSGHEKIGMLWPGIRTGEFEPDTPRLPLRFLARAIGRACEFQRYEGDAASAQEVTTAIFARLISVAEAIAHEIASARIARGGPICAPMLAEQDVLHQIEQGGLASAERSRNQDVLVHVENLAEAIPSDGNDASEGNALAHGAPSSTGLCPPPTDARPSVT